MSFSLGFSLFNTDTLGGGGTPSAPVNVTPASISIGDGLVGTTAVATPGAWTDADTVTGQWQYRTGSGWSNISSMNPTTELTYTLEEGQAGEDIRYLETATNAHGSTQEPSNVATTEGLSSPGNTTPPVVIHDSGNTRLVVSSDGVWSGNPPPGGYTYQWQINEFGSWADISGATTNELLGWNPGAGYDTRCVVIAYNSQGQSSAESNTFA